MPTLEFLYPWKHPGFYRLGNTVGSEDLLPEM